MTIKYILRACSLIGLSLASTQLTASPILLGISTLTGSSDMSGLSSTLENGNAANILGGLGSGLAYAGNNTFLALPDRGPNASPYTNGVAVDQTTSYIPRFQTLSMQLTANTTSGLPFVITPKLESTTLLYSTAPLNYATNGAPAENTSNQFYFSGRSDNFISGSSGNPDNARLDPESIRVSNDGKSVFISDEYGPYVYQFDRATGERIKTFALPSNLDVTNLSSIGDTEISGNTAGRTANKGMEGLAITPDGSTLVGIMQAPLLQDTSKTVRIVTVDIASGATHEYAYNLTTGSGVSEIVALNSHEFLIDERDGKGLGDNSSAAVKQVFRIDLNNAQEISDKSGNISSYAVTKSLALDLKNLLVNAGINAKNIPAKIEGMTFGEDIVYNNTLLHTLWIANDNDFLSTITDSNHPNGFANPNNFYVVGLSDKDLPGYFAQTVSVPEPQNIILMVLGLLGLMSARRSSHA